MTHPEDAAKLISKTSTVAESDSIPFLRPRLPSAEEYLPYLIEIDANNWYSNFGPLVGRFEEGIRQAFFGGNGSICSVMNCTLGLMLALRATAKPRGKYVIMPSFTFAATPLAAAWAGFEPYFVDVQPDTWTLDTDKVAAAIDMLGDDLAAVMPYTTFGTALELGFYQRLQDKAIPVIIDAAPTLGTTNSDGSPFAAKFSGCVVFSLHATKPFGIGEGGLVYSSNPDVMDQIRRLSNFGFSSPGIAVAAGLNAKLPEMSAAVGLAVLKTYAQKVVRLEGIFQEYRHAIERSDRLRTEIRIQKITGNIVPQFMPILLPETFKSKQICDRLASVGIETRCYFSPPCHRQPLLHECDKFDLPVTDQISDRIICLPLWDGMESQTPGLVVDNMARILLGAKP